MVEFLRDREAFSKLANKASSSRVNWYEINAKSDTHAEILIYSDIGWMGATAEEFITELSQITASEITVRINSDGGSVFDGFAIYNALRTHPANITIQVDAIAASIASVIAQAGNNRVMLDASEMMIHEATGIAIGATADDMEELAGILRNQSEKIANVYATAKGDPDSAGDFRNLMKAGSSNLGTWMSAQETVDQGLADEVLIPTKTAAEPVEPAAIHPKATIDYTDLFTSDYDDFEWSSTDQKENA